MAQTTQKLTIATPTINTNPVRSISSKSREKIRAVFREVDVDNDRLIDWSEIELCCEKMQMKLTKEDRKVFDECDLDGNGGLDIDEFVDFIHVRLKRVFDEIDTDKSGELDEEEIKKVMEKLGIKISQRQIQSILRDMDEDGNGSIDFREFCDFFSDVPTFDVQQMAKRWMVGEGIDIGGDSVPSLPPGETPLFLYMAAGALGGVVSRTMCSPLERIKMIAQTSCTGTNTKIKCTFLRILQNEGMRGLFSGNLANCLRVTPSGATVGLIYSRMLKYTPVDSATNPHQPVWRLIAGATAGMVSTVVTHPLDVVRARLTVQEHNGKNCYTGIANTFKRIIAEEGARGLYKGLTPAVQSVAPFMAVQQSLYDILKIHMSDTEYAKHPATFLACGAFAGTTAQTLVHPLEVVRRLKQIDKTNENGAKLKSTSLTVLRSLWKEGGITRLYAGITASYLKVIPTAAISLIVRDAVLGRLGDDD